MQPTMKKIALTICVLAAATFAFTSCEKNRMETLYVEMETATDGSKAHMDENTQKPMLVTGDSAYVNDGIFGFDFENGNPILKVNHASDNVYRAIFPANIVNTTGDIAHSDNVNVIIPNNQNYSIENGVQKVDMPMISYPLGNALWFRNICSLVKVNVTNVSNEPVELSYIQVSNNLVGESGIGSVYLSGNTRVNVASSEPVITVDNGQFRYVQLNLNGHPDATLAAGQTGSYYLIVAPFTDATQGVNIRVGSTYHFNDLPLNNVTSLARNTIAVVNFNFN